MSVGMLQDSVTAPAPAVLSLDIFDTVLLRDGSTQVERFVKSGRRAAPRLGVDPGALAAARILAHTNAYRAISMERPGADPRFDAICRATVASVGLGGEAASVLAECEKDVDAERLKPGAPALAIIDEARARGQRVIATSDTWYAPDDVGELLVRVLGLQPFDRIYTSSELGATKHHGGIFEKVADLEGYGAEHFLHVGDTWAADYGRATAAGWAARHLSRGHAFGVALAVGRLKALVMYSRG
ncbi:HAD family hydrolase [Demequina sp. NBRC 110052]|uniref:HAD family hydrolase n=1 Tax=Demequina sp. NBRC 110052 TaxID=1570341 RepID=UPI001356524A|nr:HAD family hydrolase [Demequina sp. NBRC 110052]